MDLKEYIEELNQFKVFESELTMNVIGRLFQIEEETKRG